MPTADLTGFPQQAAFAEEDDYDMEDASDPPPSALTAPPARSLSIVPLAIPSIAPGVVRSLAAPHAQPAASAGLAGPQAAELQPPQSDVLPTPGVPQHGHPAAAPFGLAMHMPVQFQSVPPFVAPQPAAFQLPAGRAKPVTLQEQMQLAAASGIVLPVVTASNGRSMLRYSDLLPSVDSKPAEQLPEQADAASRARVRAERLNALTLQTSTDAAKVAAATAAGEDDSDEESFLHAKVMRKLPEHLVDSSTLSDESDSDVVISEADAEEHSAGKAEAQAQSRDKQSGPQPRCVLLALLL